MGSVITIIIVIVAVILQITKAVREQREAGGSDEGWWEEEGKSSTAPAAKPQPTAVKRPPPVPAAPSRPTPSPHVQAILRQLQQQAQVQAAPPKPKPAPAAPPPPPEVRHYLNEQEVEAELAQAAKAVTEQAVTKVYTQSASAAFPLVRQVRPQRHAGQRGPIRVKAHGKANLRQAILLGEVLGPPRAFDL